MNIFAKAVMVASAVSFLSACQLTTAPQSSTYWVKKSPDNYQTHQERIRTHDKMMECKEQVADRLDEYEQTAAQTEKLVSDCMIENHYELHDNWYEIKKTKK